jgi:hypothetical protein
MDEWVSTREALRIMGKEKAKIGGSTILKLINSGIGHKTERVNGGVRHFFRATELEKFLKYSKAIAYIKKMLEGFRIEDVTQWQNCHAPSLEHRVDELEARVHHIEETTAKLSKIVDSVKFFENDSKQMEEALLRIAAGGPFAPLVKRSN